MKQYMKTGVYSLLLLVHLLLTVWAIEYLVNYMSQRVHVILFTVAFISVGIVMLAFVGMIIKFIKHLKSYIK
jgi:hypothetical protein